MSNGYLMVAMGGTKLLLHRLVYAWHGGELTPDDVVDHIDGNPANNRIQNLRACSRAENQWNRRTKTSLPKGVHWSKREQRYKVSIRAKPATHFIGTYKTLDEASAAAAEAKAKYHGEFSRG
jgi:hypothetical protein